MVSIQLIRIIYYRHLLFSFQGGFLCLCFTWTLLRVTFWFFVDLSTWPVWLSDFIYVLPSVCECATFGLLILFYAKLALPQQWPARKLNFATAYMLANTAMLVLTILLAGISNDANQSVVAARSRDTVETVFFLSSGCYFGALVILASYFVVKLYQSTDASRAGIRQSKQTVIVTGVCFIVFFSRCVFDFLSASGRIASMHVYHTGSPHSHSTKTLPGAALSLLLLWEVVPTLLVLVYFGKIPKTRVAMPIFDCCFRCMQLGGSNDSSDTGSEYSSADDISPVIGKVRVYQSLETHQFSPALGTAVDTRINSGRWRDYSVPGSSSSRNTGGGGHSSMPRSGHVFDNVNRYSLSDTEFGGVARASHYDMAN